MKAIVSFICVWFAVFANVGIAADWTQFRGPGGLATSDEKGLPTTWSSTKNIVWRVELPGPGTSSPIALDGRVYLTCYTGYGLKPNEGNMDDLMRHVLCIDRKTGRIRWTRDFKPELPESVYRGGNDSQHGYASSTAVTDGQRLFVFFGKSGLYCLDFQGNQLWHSDVGQGTHGWGSSNSPVLYKDLVIINASVEARTLIAFNKQTGKEVWRAGRIRSAWNTPVLVDLKGGRTELAVSTPGTILAFDPASGEELWRSKGLDGYICPSLIAQDRVVYGIRNAALAVRAGGRGDVTETNELWRTQKGSVVSSPVYHEGHIYWMRGGGTCYCVDATTGKIVYEKRVKPGAGTVYASVIAADGKLYCVSQRNGVFVLAAKPEFEQLAHNQFADDNSRTNASPIVSEGHLLMRTDRFLYCIGEQ